MTPDLKQRLLDAIQASNSMYQTSMANTIGEAMDEIERLTALLASVHTIQAPAFEKLNTEILPLLRRLESPTQEMREAMEGKTPYSWARSADKTTYQVTRLENEDWRVVSTDEQSVVFESTYESEVSERCAALQFIYRYSEMLRVASEQPL